MNLQNILKKLSPKKHAYVIEGETIYIHRARSKDIEALNTPLKAVVVCTCDEMVIQFSVPKISKDVLISMR